jgi:hypothetical protein
MATELLSPRFIRLLYSPFREYEQANDSRYILGIRSKINYKVSSGALKAENSGNLGSYKYLESIKSDLSYGHT